jgi:metal-responsive CopG/Arc/MetJ family transcriptional regulator
MDALHSTNPLRDPLRSAKVSVNLAPAMAARLDRLGRRNHWTRSTAAAVLIERGLAEDDERERGKPLLAG